MKKIFNILFAVLLLVSSILPFTACNKGEENMEKQGTFVNIDPDLFYWIYSGDETSHTDLKTAIENYVDVYANHNVSDIAFCIFEQTSMTPSNVWTFRGDKKTWTNEGGTPVDYSNEPFILCVDEFFNRGNCNPVQTLLDTAKNKGMNPWITFRMNDSHYHGDQTAYLRGKEYYTLNNEGQQNHGNRSAYFDTTFNFEDDTVRNRYLAYLKEQINAFDMYGVELDFSRDIFCFEYWLDDPSYFCKIMNNFIKTVKEYITEREKVLGHDVKLMVRLYRDIEQCRVFGFDVKNWIDNGYVDALVPSPRWGSNDSDIPISDWVALTKGTKTKIYAGQEILLGTEMFGDTHNNLENMKAYASSAFAQGASKVYLSNYFYTYKGEEEKEMLGNVYETLSSEENANEGKRCYVMTYQELDTVPKRYDKYQFNPLPKSLDSGDILTVNLGEIKEDDQVTVYCQYKGVTKTGEKPTLTIDGHPLTYDENDTEINVENTLTGKICAYKINNISLKGGSHKIKFTFNDIYPTLTYLEVKTERA